MSQKSIAIIVTKGTLDWAYPPFILASTATALGWECRMFFTLYGLRLLKKELQLEVSPLGNPALTPRVPVLLRMMPGMQSLFTRAMHRKIQEKGIAGIEELRRLCQEAEVRMFACQMTADLHEYRKEELIDGVEAAGAATFFDVAHRSDICLFT
jgi:peroxiredoxin family protein